MNMAKYIWTLYKIYFYPTYGYKIQTQYNMVVIKHIKMNIRNTNHKFKLRNYTLKIIMIRVSINEKRGYLEVLKLPPSSAFLAALLGESKISQEMAQRDQSGAHLTH